MFRLSLTMILRDWRAGELRFLLAALALAVASLSAVGFFTDRLGAAMRRDANQLLAADLVAHSGAPLSAAWRAKAVQLGLRTADVVELTSMAIGGTDPDGGTQLVELKAVGPAYPLRGAVAVHEGAARRVMHSAPTPGTAWVDPALLSALGLRTGAALRLGERSFTITQVIAAEPDRGLAAMAYIPRVMIAAQDLPHTGLVAPASFADYKLLVAGDAAPLRAFETWAGARRGAGIRIETLASSHDEMRSMLERGTRFLALVGLLSAMLAAVAVAMAVRAFMQRHADACAMLRCLGLGEGAVARLYLVQFVLLGLAGSIGGVVCGFACHYLLLDWLGGLVTSDLPAPGWLPAWRGLAIGTLLLAGYAWPCVLQMRGVPHNRLLRRQAQALGPLTIGSWTTALVLFVGLLLWQAGDVELGLMTGAGFALALLAFALLARLALAALGRLPAFGATAWRLALADVVRRPRAAVAQVVALALGLTALLLLTLVRGDLLASWRHSTPADAPNHAVLNIQPDQRAAVAARLRAFGAPGMMPATRARLVAHNGMPIDPANYPDQGVRAMLARELAISSARALPPASRLTAGRWFGAAADAVAQASLSQVFARDLNIKLGDRLTLEVGGSPLQVTVTSLRKVDRRARQPGFAILVDPATGAALPATWLAAVYVPPGQEAAMSRLARAFPNLSVLNVGSVLAQLQAVLDQVSAAVEFLFVFTLGSGVMVLYATVASAQKERTRQAAILRALGASRQQLARAQRIEAGLIGALAGLIAAAAASCGGWALARFVFKLDWHFSALPMPVGVAAGVACALLGAWPGLRAVLHRPPLASLRA